MNYCGTKRTLLTRFYSFSFTLSLHQTSSVYRWIMNGKFIGLLIIAFCWCSASCFDAGKFVNRLIKLTLTLHFKIPTRSIWISIKSSDWLPASTMRISSRPWTSLWTRANDRNREKVQSHNLLLNSIDAFLFLVLVTRAEFRCARR